METMGKEAMAEVDTTVETDMATMEIDHQITTTAIIVVVTGTVDTGNIMMAVLDNTAMDLGHMMMDSGNRVRVDTTGSKMMARARELEDIITREDTGSRVMGTSARERVIKVIKAGVTTTSGKTTTTAQKEGIAVQTGHRLHSGNILIGTTTSSPVGTTITEAGTTTATGTTLVAMRAAGITRGARRVKGEQATGGSSAVGAPKHKLKLRNVTLMVNDLHASII